MTTEEFVKLVKKANKAKQGTVCVFFAKEKWHLTKSGPTGEDLDYATFDEVVERLKQWARPEFTTLSIPTETAAVIYASLSQRASFPTTKGPEIEQALHTALTYNGVIPSDYTPIT